MPHNLFLLLLLLCQCYIHYFVYVLVCDCFFPSSVLFIHFRIVFSLCNVPFPFFTFSAKSFVFCLPRDDNILRMSKRATHSLIANTYACVYACIWVWIFFARACLSLFHLSLCLYVCMCACVTFFCSSRMRE